MARLKLNLVKAELDRLKQLAAARGLRTSLLVRWLLLKKPIPATTPVRTLSAELARTAANLTQLQALAQDLGPTDHPLHLRIAETHAALTEVRRKLLGLDPPHGGPTLSV